MTAPAESSATTQTKLIAPDGSSAWVTVGGKVCEVYQPKQTAEKMSGYIESREGVEFTVHFADARARPTCALDASLFLDGTKSEGYVIRPGSHRKEALFRGRPETSTSVRPYHFAKLALTDDSEKSCDDENVIKGLGTIVVKVCRVTVLGPRSKPITYAPEKEKIINERMKKAQLSHQTGLGVAKHEAAVSRVGFNRIDGRDTPLLTFEFMYRSRALLELESIVPTPEEEIAETPVAGPSRAKTSGKRASDGDAVTGDDIITDEDPQAELKRLRAEVGAALKMIKAEPGAKRIKTEAQQGSQGAKKGEPEVIIIDD